MAHKLISLLFRLQGSLLGSLLHASQFIETKGLIDVRRLTGFDDVALSLKLPFRLLSGLLAGGESIKD
jgi:hypothetical protein